MDPDLVGSGQHGDYHGRGPVPQGRYVLILRPLFLAPLISTNPDTIRKVLSGLASFKDFGMEGLKDGTHAAIAASVSISKDVVTADTAYDSPLPTR